MSTSEFDWSRITNDLDFQDLVSCMLLQVISKHVQIFLKPGKDYGIDASYKGPIDGKDGNWVFQFKFYSEFSNLKKALKKKGTEKGEVELLQERLDALPGTVAYNLWNGVNRYRLITNLVLLPQERQEILDILKPVADKGIDIDIWDGAKVKSLSESSAFVLQQIFGSAPPLYVPGVEYCRLQEASQFGQYLSILKYVDIDFLTQLKEFLNSSNKVALLRGTGGIGKTRTLIELVRMLLTDANWEVLAIQDTTEEFDQHLPQIPPGKNCVILVDDAERFRHFSKLLGLVTRHRSYRGRIKIIAACRSAVSKPVEMEIKRAAITEMLEIELPDLGKKLDKLTEQLGCTKDESSALIRVAAGIPLWVILGSVALKSGVPIYEISKERIIRFFIERYLSEVAPDDKPLHAKCLDVLSALEPINIKDEKNRTLLAKLVDDEVPHTMRVYEDLLRSGFVQLRGRYLKIVPDIVSDYILVHALFISQGIPTDLHKSLLSSEVPSIKILVNNLAKAELTSGHSILQEVVAKLTNDVCNLDNLQRIRLLESYNAIGYVRPAQFLGLVETIMSVPKPDLVRDGLFKKDVTTHLDVLRHIPSALRGVLRWEGHRLEALDAIAIVAEAEDFKHKAGRGAILVFEKATKFSNYFPYSFMQQNLSLCRDWFSGKKHRRPLIEILIRNLLRIETEEEEFDGSAVVFTTGRMVMTPTVRSIRNEALDLLETMTSSKVREDRMLAVTALHDAWREIKRVLPENRTVRAQKVPAANATMSDSDKNAQANEELVFLNHQMERINNIVETMLIKETDYSVLALIENFLSWDRQFNVDDAARRNTAHDLTKQIYKKQHFSLFAALDEKLSCSDYNDMNVDELVNQIIAESRPDNLSSEIVTIMKTYPSSGSASGLFSALASRDPIFALRILVAIHVKKDTVRSHISNHAVSQIVATLRFGFNYVDLPGYLANIDPWWKQTVACTAPHYYRAASEGKPLSASDIHLLKAFAADPEPKIHIYSASLLRLLVPNQPIAAKEIISSLLGHSEIECVAEDAAQSLLTLIQKDGENLDYAKRQSNGFVEVPKIGYWLLEFLTYIGGRDPEWFVEFFEKRIAHENGKSSMAYEPMPVMTHNALEYETETPSASVENAVLRALMWHRRDTSYQYHKLDMLEWLIDPKDAEAVFRLVEKLLDAKSAENLEIASELLVGLGCNDANKDRFLQCVGRILIVSTQFANDPKNRIWACISKVFDVPSWSAAIGETPEVFLEQQAILRRLAAMFPNESSVREFVARELSSIEEMAASLRERHAEIGIEG